MLQAVLVNGRRVFVPSRGTIRRGDLLGEVSTTASDMGGPTGVMSQGPFMEDDPRWLGPPVQASGDGVFTGRYLPRSRNRGGVMRTLPFDPNRTGMRYRIPPQPMPVDPLPPVVAVPDPAPDVPPVAATGGGISGIVASITDWIKANPLLAAGGGIAIYFVLFSGKVKF